MTVRVEAIRDVDRGAWLPLWRGYQAFYETDIPPEVSEATWSRFLDPSEPVHAALAWRDGASAGLAHWIMQRSCWTAGDNCYLQDLFVAPDVRNGGVGRALIEHVRRQAEHAGCAKLHWQTRRTNATAQALYDRVAQRSEFMIYEIKF